MKYFYYLYKNQQLGPFTFEELTKKRLLKSTLVWTDGLENWIEAEKIPELKSILTSEPPPLPKTFKENNVTENYSKENNTFYTTISTTTTPYKKEIQALFIGIVLFFIPILVVLQGGYKIEFIKNYEHSNEILLIILFSIRFYSAIWVKKIAKRQNRNQTFWGWFGFLFPSISLISIGLLKKLAIKIDLENSLSKEEKSNLLKVKATKLKSENKYEEAIFFLEKIYEINPSYDNIRLDIHNYKKEFQDRKIQNYYIVQKPLINNYILEIEFDKTSTNFNFIGCKVKIEGHTPIDCYVRLENEDYRYEIINGIITNIFIVKKFKQHENYFLEIDNKVFDLVLYPKKGSRAWVNNNPAPDGIYKIGLLSKVVIKNGVVD